MCGLALARPNQSIKRRTTGGEYLFQNMTAQSMWDLQQRRIGENDKRERDSAGASLMATAEVHLFVLSTDN